MSSLDEQLSLINSRLARIEHQLQLSPIESPTAPSPQPQAAATSPDTSYKLNSSNILGIIAIACFILAAGFIIKLSIDSGWLTPRRQVCIAALFGLSLIVTGLKLLSIDREYASLLPATGIVVLYLSIFAGYRLYSLTSFEIAMILSSAVSVLCISLYFRIKNEIYTHTAAIGAYVSPAILGLNINSTFTLYYFVICSLTFSTLSIFVKSRSLSVVAAYLAIMTTALVGLDLYQNYLIALMLVLQFLIFSLGAALYTQHTKNPLTLAESWAFFPTLLVFYVAEFHFVSLINADMAAWLSIAFAGFLIALYLAAKRTLGDKALTSGPMIITFSALVLFHAGYIELIPDDGKTWLLAIMLLGLSFLPNKSFNKTSTMFKLPAFVIGMLCMIIISVEYLKLAASLLATSDKPDLLVDVVVILSIWTLFIRKKEFLSKDEAFAYIVLGAAHYLVIATLYDQTHTYNSLAVSVSWLIYAIAIILFAFTRKDRLMANSALFVLGLAAGKALIYDAASTPTIVRIACLLLTGGVLYASGYLFKKIAAWKN